MSGPVGGGARRHVHEEDSHVLHRFVSIYLSLFHDVRLRRLNTPPHLPVMSQRALALTLPPGE